ncbi:MAG: hypothetical protein C4539_14285 [Ignavibacteriales bacterium]|nr:MAG: hypothetical protein C4539_14285 [Ignavibacteriales bacterium]
MSYLTRIIKIENGKPIFSNEISDSHPIGEIKLQKYPSDNICNICLSEKELTFDHVPPKCTGNEGLYHYVNLYNYMVNSSIEYKGISQDGIKYQTICKKCNNEILKQYDDEINILFNTFKTVKLSNKLILKLTIKPNKIIRGILGHFLSAKTSHIRTSMEDIFADAITYPSKPIDKSLGFYVVPYFYDQIRVIRDLLIDYNRVIVNCIKIYPLAFIVTQPKYFPNLPDWSCFFDVEPDLKYDVELFGMKECKLEWPERYFHPIYFGKNGVESIIGFPDEMTTI